MNKLQRSWLLMKNSLSVVGRNKLLLVFPVVTFLCTAVIILFFLAPPVLRPTQYGYATAEHWQAISHSLFRESPEQGGQAFSPGALAYLAFLYFVAMFVATFSNVAFYHEILVALTGQPVSIGRGLKFAATKIRPILMWTLLAGVVGLIIKAIEQRLSWVGQIFGKLIGVAWSVAAVFAIPVIVRDEQTSNPIAVLRKSADVLKRTWGEALIGYIGLSFANSLIVLGSLLWLAGAVFVSIWLHNYWMIAVAAVGWLLALIAWGYVSNVASQVYRGALYLYAAEGFIPAPYDQAMLDQAWKFKKN